MISLAAGLAHAYTPSTRTPACSRGYVLTRGKCVLAATPPTTRPTTPPPQVPQPRPQTASNSTAITCPLGQKLRGGKCTLKQCPMGMTVNGEGKCDCTPGLKKVDNRCVNESLLQSCPGGVLSKKGNCVMPTANPQKICPPNHQLNANGKCQLVESRPCPSGQRKNRKNKCIPIVVGQSCGADLWIDAQGKCGTTRVNGGCPEGKERNGMDNCVKIQTCTAGQVKDKTGQCVELANNNL